MGMNQNIINNNRFFSRTIESFFNNYNSDHKKIYCDIDSIYQYPNYKNCYYINHIQNHNIFGDKYTHYNLLMQNNQKTKFLLETYLFHSNPNIINKDNHITHTQLKKIVQKYKIWIIKPRNDYGRNGVTIIRNYSDIQNWVQKKNLNNGFYKNMLIILF